MINSFDKASRYAARHLDPLGLLCWLLGQVFMAAWRWTRWLDTQSVPFPGMPDRRADTVAEFERRTYDAPPVAVVIEFLSEPSGEALERLADYCLVFRRELPYQTKPLVKYDVIGVLVNLTGGTASDEWSMCPEDAGGLGMRLKVGLRNLANYSGPQTLTGVATGSLPQALLAWVALMARANTPEVVQEWRRLVEAKVDEHQRPAYGAVALVFADLAGCLAVWKTGLEGWNVKTSQIVEEWKAEGQLQASRAKLLRVLQFRFGTDLPVDLQQAVEGQSDPTTLDRWFDLALAATSLDHFRTAFSANGA
jgi:hypothetical protein